MGGTAAALKPASLRVTLYDGERNPFAGGKVLITVLDGDRKEISSVRTNKVLEIFDGIAVQGNATDFYTVLASTRGYQSTGFFPVKMQPGAAQWVDLMLVPKDPNFAFQPWSKLPAESWRPTKNRYTKAMEDEAEGLACALNITSAMSTRTLPDGVALDYIRAIDWDELQPDRIFCWCDPMLEDQIRMGLPDDTFVQQSDADLAMHPGAVSSYKETMLAMANLQFTFHGDVSADGSKRLEVDIDLYSDLFGHGLLEVFPNWITRKKTDPRAVYALRWMSGRRAHLANFEPLYTLTSSLA